MNSIFKALHILIIAFSFVLIQSCKKDEVAIVSKAETSAVSQLTITCSTQGGFIALNGGSNILSVSPTAYTGKAN